VNIERPTARRRIFRPLARFLGALIDLPAFLADRCMSLMAKARYGLRGRLSKVAQVILFLMAMALMTLSIYFISTIE
jgi:hypothetical protein